MMKKIRLATSERGGNFFIVYGETKHTVGLMNNKYGFSLVE